MLSYSEHKECEKRRNKLSNNLTVSDFKKFIKINDPELFKKLSTHNLFNNKNRIGKADRFSKDYDREILLKHNSDFLEELINVKNISSELAETIVLFYEIQSKYKLDIYKIDDCCETCLVNSLVRDKLSRKLTKEGYSSQAKDKIIDFTLGSGFYGILGKKFWTNKSFQLFGIAIVFALSFLAIILFIDRIINPNPTNAPIILYVSFGLFWIWVIKEVYIEYKVFNEFYPYYKKNLNVKK